MQIFHAYFKFTPLVLTFLFSSISAQGNQATCPDAEYFDKWRDESYSSFVTKASRSSLLEEKRKQYCTGRVSPWKIGKSIAKESAKTISGAYASYWIASRLMPNPANAVPGTSPAVMAFVSAVTTAITGSITNLATALENSDLTLDEGLKYVHTELQQSSAELIKEHSKEFQTKLEALDNTIAQMIFDRKGDTALKYLKRREEVFLALPKPTQSLDVAQYGKNSDPELRRIIDVRVDELVQSHPEYLREPVELLIQNIRDNSIAKEGRQVQTYLYGPAGTGKTRFVNRLGKTLGLHVCHIDIGKIEPGEICSLPYDLTPPMLDF